MDIVGAGEKDTFPFKPKTSQPHGKGNVFLGISYAQW